MISMMCPKMSIGNEGMGVDIVEVVVEFELWQDVIPTEGELPRHMSRHDRGISG